LLCVVLLASCGRQDLQESKEDRLFQVNSGETIHVRMAGCGPSPVVLLAGNNCSGRSFEPLLALVEATQEIREAYTFYAFDYRGSGDSTYVHPVESLADFARDFADVVQTDTLLQAGNITLVGHSMGFGVAQLMVDLDPSKYSGIVSLAGIGTRGVRVLFAGNTVGDDPATGLSYSAGDWADSQSAVAFHQRSWGGENRTAVNASVIWNLVVFNDVLQFDPRLGIAADSTYLDNPGYLNAIEDVLSTVYMPESLYASHRFNATSSILQHTNRDGTSVSIPGADRTAAFDGKRVLLVKAQTDRISWRGDLVIDDSITRNTKYDLRQAGATVTAVMLHPNTGYDHGFPIHHPAETMQLITAFAESTKQLTDEALSSVFGVGTYDIYPDAETEWERKAYGGF
jgi:pimeloyl-ACP methyl ester carboxylesterase